MMPAEVLVTKISRKGIESSFSNSTVNSRAGWRVLACFRISSTFWARAVRMVSSTYLSNTLASGMQERGVLTDGIHPQNHGRLDSAISLTSLTERGVHFLWNQVEQDAQRIEEPRHWPLAWICHNHNVLVELLVCMTSLGFPASCGSYSFNHRLAKITARLEPIATPSFWTYHYPQATNSMSVTASLISCMKVDLSIGGFSSRSYTLSAAMLIASKTGTDFLHP